VEVEKREIREEKSIKRMIFFVGVFLINLPIPKAMKKMANIPINPESAVETFSFFIHGMA